MAVKKTAQIQSESLEHGHILKKKKLSLFFNILGDKVDVSVYSYGH